MIILASSSQRRIDLLNDAGIKFEVKVSTIDEQIDNSITPKENAMKLALEKATDVYNKYPGNIVIAADTMVVFNNEIFGKPKDEEDAFNMLKKLSNNKHQVITGVAIVKDNYQDVFESSSMVKFKNLTDDEIRNYVATKEPFGKAGGYAIQGLGKDIVDTYEGDFFTIIGLPLKEVVKRIKALDKE